MKRLKAPAMAQPHSPPTELYLVTPPVADVGAFLPILDEALGAAQIACLLLNLTATDDGAAKKAARSIGDLVQPRGCALLLAGWTAIAARAGADGVHVTGSREALR